MRLITQQQEQIIQLQAQVEALEAESPTEKTAPKPDIKPNTELPDDGTGAEQPAVGNDDSTNPYVSRKRKVNKPKEKTRKQRNQPRH